MLQADAKARILIAGQAPGMKVHETGKPFNDPSGRRLRTWLGVSEAQFYDETQFAIVPMGFCYPGKGLSGDLPPRPECAQTWHEQLLGALQNIELTVVLGRYAMDYHLPRALAKYSRPKSRPKSITQAVQSWQDYWPDLVVLPHPSPRNIAWFQRNSWFAQKVIPSLQQRVSEILND